MQIAHHLALRHMQGCTCARAPTTQAGQQQSTTLTGETPQVLLLPCTARPVMRAVLLACLSLWQGTHQVLLVALL
jgi:hypothetical protein